MRSSHFLRVFACPVRVSIGPTFQFVTHILARLFLTFCNIQLLCTSTGDWDAEGNGSGSISKLSKSDVVHSDIYGQCSSS